MEHESICLFASFFLVCDSFDVYFFLVNFGHFPRTSDRHTHSLLGASEGQWIAECISPSPSRRYSRASARTSQEPRQTSPSCVTIARKSFFPPPPPLKKPQLRPSELINRGNTAANFCPSELPLRRGLRVPLALALSRHGQAVTSHPVTSPSSTGTPKEAPQASNAWRPTQHTGGDHPSRVSTAD